MDNAEEKMKSTGSITKTQLFAFVSGKLVHIRKSGSMDLLIEEGNDKFIELCSSFQKEVIGETLLGIFPEFAAVLNDPVIKEGVTGDLYSGASFDVKLTTTGTTLKVYFSKPEKSFLSFMIKVVEVEKDTENSKKDSHLEFLNSLFDELGVDPEENIGVIVAKANLVLKGACSMYNRFDETEKSLLIWSGSNTPADLNQKDAAQGHICYETVIKDGKRTVAISDLQDTCFYESDPNVKKYNLRSYLGHPVIMGEKVVGSLCVLDTKVRHFTDMERRIIATLAVALSLEHRRYLLELKLNNALSQARLANEAKSQFLSNMSHEIRTPLNGIMGFSDILIREETDAKKRWMLELIEESGRQLTKIVNDIFDYAAVDSGKITLSEKIFNLSHLIDDTSLFFSRDAKSKGLDIQVIKTGIKNDRLKGDYFKLSQILINLISNAVKFTDKGSVVIHVTTASQMDKIMAEISIADSGIGIHAKDMETIFDEFRQVEDYLTKRIDGTGIGLTTSKRLVEFLGGSIQAESEPGKGSRFTVTIPLKEAGEEPHSDITESVGEPSEEKDKNIHILLAEDNETNQFLIKALTRSKDWNITIVDNGEKAVEAYKQNSFNLILMDVQMPVMNGYDATRIIREIEKDKGVHIPIIALTAYAMKDDKEMCLDAGMDDYIAKPFKRNEFLEIVSKRLGSA